MTNQDKAVIAAVQGNEVTTELDAKSKVLLDDLSFRKRMLETLHAQLISRNKSVGASSDFQYDLAFLAGANFAAKTLGVDFGVLTIPNFRN